MAFKKLDGCDGSDMSLWGRQAPTLNFEAEIITRRDMAVRKLLDCKACSHDEYANRVKAFNDVLGLITEARDMK